MLHLLLCMIMADSCLEDITLRSSDSRWGHCSGQSHVQCSLLDTIFTGEILNPKPQLNPKPMEHFGCKPIRIYVYERRNNAKLTRRQSKQSKGPCKILTSSSRYLFFAGCTRTCSRSNSGKSSVLEALVGGDFLLRGYRVFGFRALGSLI
jgi:hypothetical protein